MMCQTDSSFNEIELEVLFWDWYSKVLNSLTCKEFQSETTISDGLGLY